MFFRKVSRNYQFVLLVVLGVALCRSLFSFYFSCGSVTNTNRQRTLDYIKHSTSDILDFEGFDNNSTKPGRPLIVPNIVHFIFLNTTRVKFHEMICIFAAYLNQRPDTIMIHCEDCNFKGKYWDQLYSVGPLRRIMQIKKLPVKRGLYGRIAPNNRYIMAHRADLWRVQILSQYGGMYLDNDAYVVNSIDKYRVFEMTVGLENTNGVTLGNQILIAHKNARMLKAWTDMYRYDYRENEWFYNGGYVPGLIVRNSSYLVHLEPTRLGTFLGTGWLYLEYKADWRQLFETWHLMYNHRHYMAKPSFDKYEEFNEEIANRETVTFAEMCRDVLKRIKELPPAPKKNLFA